MERRINLFRYLPQVICYWVLFISCPAVVFSQESFDFDKRYNEAYSLMSSNVQSAFEKGEVLLNDAEDDVQRMKTLMLIANIQHSRGEISSAMHYIVRAQRIAKLKGDPDWIARTSGFLATTFRNYGLFEESKKYLADAETANEKQKDKASYSITRINIEQEKALTLINESKYKEALSHLKEADAWVGRSESMNDPRAIVAKATVYQLMGVAYYNLKDYVKTDEVLRVSLEKLGEQESNLRPYIYRVMAENHLALGQSDSTYYYLQLAEKYIESSEGEELKMNVYETYASYYKGIGNAERAMHYTDLRQKITAKRGASTAQIASELIERLNQEKQFAILNIKLFWVFGTLVLIGGGLGVYYLLWSKKREVAQFEKLLEEIEKKNLEQQNLLKEMKLDSFSVDKNLAADTEKRLLYDLVKLELDNFFINPEVSTTSLARDLGTNTKYITYLIRKYRKSDFNDYIQYQRILYISNRLKTEPALWDYKLSYLAEMAGFPTHSMFSVAFKNVTGITPSSFIERIKMNQVIALEI